MASFNLQLGLLGVEVTTWRRSQTRHRSLAAFAEVRRIFSLREPARNVYLQMKVLQPPLVATLLRPPAPIP